MIRPILLLLFSISSLIDCSCPIITDHLIGNRCYTLVAKNLTYEDARFYCRVYGYPQSTLATVSNPNEPTFLASWAMLEFGETWNFFWIGANRATVSSPFHWEDGTPFVWTHFEFKTSVNYVAEDISNGYWGTFDSANLFPFVCSYPWTPKHQ